MDTTELTFKAYPLMHWLMPSHCDEVITMGIPLSTCRKCGATFDTVEVGQMALIANGATAETPDHEVLLTAAVVVALRELGK